MSPAQGGSYPPDSKGTPDGSRAPMPDASRPDASRPVRVIADDYLQALAEFDPAAAQARGTEDVTEIPDLSPDAFRARVALDRRTLSRLEHAPATADRADRVLAAAMSERLGSDVALYDTGFTPSLLAPLATPVHLVRQVFDGLPRQAPADWERVLRHLRLVPLALDQYADTLRWSASCGHVAPARQIRVVADQAVSWVDPDGTDFYRGLVTSHPGAPGVLASELVASAREASAATQGFAAFLREELLPQAPQQDGVGTDLYAVTARCFLGADVDPEEVHAFGWEELRRLDAEARAVAGELGAGSVAEACALLDADPTRRVEGVDALTSWLQARLDETLDAVDGRHFHVPARTRRVECQVTTAASGVMYYAPPDPGLTRPGRVWWTLPPGTSSASTWREVTTLHHEGVPGHHLQHAITLDLEELHPWQRALCHVHGYAEGWAHYSERLADELGLVRDAGERLGMLLGELWRAARIVVDSGLHLHLPIAPGNGFTDADAWTPVAGREFLVEVARLDAHTAGFEVDRYLGWPGQALAFRIGARVWREARAAAERRGGDRFDLAAFHDAALRLGPLGLAPLRGELERPGTVG